MQQRSKGAYLNKSYIYLKGDMSILTSNYMFQMQYSYKQSTQSFNE
jgi:hypothetical protein